MSGDSVEQNVRCKLAKVLGVSAKDLSASKDLFMWGLDSIRTIELVVELEACFDIIFHDEELLFENFSTLQMIVDRVQGKLVASS